MTTDERTGMTVLDQDTCWELLETTPLARLAVAVGDELEVFPVNVVVDERTVVFRTGEGTKLAAATMARQVVVEADGLDAAAEVAWSVVVKGKAERLDDFDEIYRVEQLPLPAWSGHPKQWFVRVHPHQVSGRRFRIAG